FRRELRQSVGAGGRAEFEYQCAPFDIAEPAHLLTECIEQRVRKFATRCQDANARRPTGRLRARRERPRCCPTAVQRDELALFHSITSSASCCKCRGTLMPNAFAVLRLITSSYLVGACTGSSAGFAPLGIRSMYSAALVYWSITSGP